MENGGEAADNAKVAQGVFLLSSLSLCFDAAVLLEVGSPRTIPIIRNSLCRRSLLKVAAAVGGGGQLSGALSSQLS